MSRRSARSHVTGSWVLSPLVVATMLTWTTDGAAEFDPEHQCDAAAAWIKNIGLPASNDAFAYALQMSRLPIWG